MVHEGDIAALADCHNSNGDAYVLHESTTPRTTYVAKGCCLEIVIMEAAVTTVPEFPPRLSLLQVYRMYSIWEVRHEILFEMLKSPISRHSTTFRDDKLLAGHVLLVERPHELNKAFIFLGNSWFIYPGSDQGHSYPSAKPSP